MSESKRKTQKEQTRLLLIETALQQFSVHGVSATPTADIAKAAGVSHGTVFAHFPTREELLISVIEEFGTRIARRMHELAEGGKGLRAILEAHLNGLMEVEAFYTRLVAERSLLPEEVRHSLVGIQSAISLHLQQAVEEEMNRGTIRRQPLHLLFNTWLGLLHYYLANGDLFAPGESVLKRYGPELLNHFLTLIAADSSTPALPGP